MPNYETDPILASRAENNTESARIIPIQAPPSWLSEIGDFGLARVWPRLRSFLAAIFHVFTPSYCFIHLSVNGAVNRDIEIDLYAPQQARYRPQPALTAPVQRLPGRVTTNRNDS